MELFQDPGPNRDGDNGFTFSQLLQWVNEADCVRTEKILHFRRLLRTGQYRVDLAGLAGLISQDL